MLLMDENAINYTDMINCPVDNVEELFEKLDSSTVLWTKQSKKRGYKVTAVKYNDIVAIVQCIKADETEEGQIYKNSVVFLDSEHDAVVISKIIYKNNYKAKDLVKEYLKKNKVKELA